MIKKILIGVLLLLIVIFLGVLFFAGSALRAGVEKGSNYALQVPTKVGSGTLNLITGKVGLSNIQFGNPPGYKSEHSIVAGDVGVAVSIGSLLSDTIVIDTINIKDPEITVDVKLGKTNLGELTDRLKQLSGGGGPAPEKKGDEGAASKKMKIREVRITGAKLRISDSILSGAGAAVSVPEIVMHDLGTGANHDETDFAGLLTRILGEMLKAAGNASDQLPGEVGKILKGEGKQVLESIGGVAKKAGDIQKSAEEAVKGVGDIFKKK